MIETLHKGEEFKKTLANISCQIEAKTDLTEPQPKNRMTQVVPPKVQEGPVVHPHPMLEEVHREEHVLPLLQPSQLEQVVIQVPPIQ